MQADHPARSRRPARVLRLALLLLALPVGVAAQTTAFTYQGQLDANGAAAAGSFDLRFGLFPTLAGGAQIGTAQTVSAVAVSEGLFTVQLDFGISAFPGANRFLEIAVRPAGSGSFTTLAPRQQISSTPYAIRTLSAATADSLSANCVECVRSEQIGSINGGKVMGPIPASSIPPESNHYIQNGSAAQASASFNVGGTGRVGDLLSAGRVAVGTAAPAAGVALQVNGLTRLTPGGSGGIVQVGTPNSETGISFVGPNNRADLRFNDSIVRLNAGPGGGPPSSLGGLAITTEGRVAIGAATPDVGRLYVIGAPDLPGIYAESANRGVWGRSTGSSRGVFGDSVSGEGVHGESISGTGVAGVTQAGSPDNPGVFGAAGGAGGVGVRGDGSTGVFGRTAGSGGVGVTGQSINAGTGVYGSSAQGPGVWGASGNGLAMFADGNTRQTRERGGWVKGMAYFNSDGSVIRCFNSFADGAAATTPPCGFSIPARVTGQYVVQAPFDIRDRFISVTPSRSGSAETSANLTIFDDGPNNRVRIDIVTVDDASGADARFMFIVF